MTDAVQNLRVRTRIVFPETKAFAYICNTCIGKCTYQTYTNNVLRIRIYVILLIVALTLMITAWAGRLTPQASVAVDTSTLISPSEKRRSTIDRSVRNIPA